MDQNTIEPSYPAHLVPDPLYLTKDSYTQVFGSLLQGFVCNPVGPVERILRFSISDYANSKLHEIFTCKQFAGRSTKIGVPILFRTLSELVSRSSRSFPSMVARIFVVKLTVV